MKRILFFGALIIMTSSCASEKLNFSPLTNGFYTETKGATMAQDLNNSMTINIKKNINASEISNLISTFPKFKNTGLNEEIINLKYSLQNYLYAIDSGNKDGKDKSIKSFEKSYRKVQKLRHYLNKDDDEVLNRYLVRLKTNITVIEDSIKGN